ncbi:sugar ABC transporter substrate-binding protein [Nocardiopsis gilva YIM 90087]|uniref:Sugar ABC transporter substrate-binding protein n=1 Tax=Nocardiopsis gilva YIM 90087 TaxID=1235441 RepID=A0A223SAI2_9ACTN|nr:substrate-binding domain-containing protein [Nocardiopsis gilva]ASU85141.1 sugar ABC transporter substrate-binding protein [Nocardiopsis gilva YIM 90087]
MPSHARPRRFSVPQSVGAGLALVLALTACGGGSDSGGEGELVGLVTKTDTNPFFVKMKQGAQKAAEEHGLDLQTYAGKYDGDNDSQVQAVENLISAGATGLLITPNDSEAIVPVLDKARKSGMLVIALDNPTDPADAADATFATDNFLAGEFIGQWAKAKFEDEDEEPRIAMLDLNPNQVAVDVGRDQGFLSGMGIDLKDEGTIGDEDDDRIVGHEVTEGAEQGGRDAMEKLLQRDPDINLVYTINEPAAAGAYEALKTAGKEKGVTIVSVDGGCPGVEHVQSGVIGATAMQFPLLMAEDGVAAVAEFTETGEAPKPSEGKDFVDTGVELITDDPVDGLDSRDTDWGLENCWG